MLDAKEVVYDLEPLLAFREVDTAYVHNRLELTLLVVAQECQNGNDCRRSDIQRQFVLQHRELLDEFGQALRQI